MSIEKYFKWLIARLSNGKLAESTWQFDIINAFECHGGSHVYMNYEITELNFNHNIIGVRHNFKQKLFFIEQSHDKK